MIAVYLKQKRSRRLENGYPRIWIQEVDRMDGVTKPGDLVRVLDHRGTFLGTGMINTHSKVMIRMISHQLIKQMDESFFEERILHCQAYRSRFLPQTESYRLVNGEADFLPGLIVDRIGDILLVRLLSAGMEVRRHFIKNVLVRLFAPRGIYEISRGTEREAEELKPRTGRMYGQVPEFVHVKQDGLSLYIDVRDPELLDALLLQRTHVHAIAPLMKKFYTVYASRHEAEGHQESHQQKNGEIVTISAKEGAAVLDCFAFPGIYSLYACKFGAKQLTCVENSSRKVKAVERNLAINGFGDRVEWIKQDSWHFIEKQALQNRSYLDKLKVDNEGPLQNSADPAKTDSDYRLWDVVIVRPPADSADTFKEMSEHILQLVSDGGFLIMAMNTQEEDISSHLELIEEAAAGAGKLLRLVSIERAGQDFPQLLHLRAETDLIFSILEVSNRVSVIPSKLVSKKKAKV